MPPPLLAADTSLLLGDDLLTWILLALGGALFVGNVLALVRPPTDQAGNDLRRAPLARSLLMAALGLVAAVWSMASLLS